MLSGYSLIERAIAGLNRINCERALKARTGWMFLTFVLVAFTNTVSQADFMTYDVSFNAQDFQVGSGGDLPPVDPVIGSFELTFDPTLTYTNETSGISVNDLNITLGSAISFSYDPSIGDGFLTIGGINGGSGFITYSPSTNDFWFFLNDFTSTPSFQQVGYTQTSVSNNNLFYTLNQTGTVSVAETQPVPEPSSMILFGLGAGISGLAAYRRKKRVASV